MENLTSSQNTIQSRAKEIDDGIPPSPMENVLLGLPTKPNSDILDEGSATSRPWTFQEFIAQKKLLADIPVNANTTGKIFEFRNTWSNIVNLHFRSLKDLFILKSWNVDLLFEFRSNFQQVGQFLLSYSPCPKSAIEYLVGEEEFYTYQMQTQLSHRKIFMGEDMNYTIKLKWLSPHKSSLYSQLLNTDDTVGETGELKFVPDDYDMGFITLSIPFQMQVATGVVSDMNVRVWSYLTDVQYAGYNPTDKIL